METPRLIKGGIAVDDRGRLSFVNDFNFNNVKRFYQVNNFGTKIIRAFHGHRKEAKYVFVPSGSILVITVPLDELEQKKENASDIKKFVLSSSNPSVLYIPKSYSHGFIALEENTNIIFFSTSTLEESKDDDIRHPFDIFGKEIWETENR